MSVALGVGANVDVLIRLVVLRVVAVAAALSEHLADLISGVLDHAGELVVAGGEHTLIVFLELDGVSEDGKADHGDEKIDEEAHYVGKYKFLFLSL